MPKTNTPPSPREKPPPKTKKRHPTLRTIGIIILFLITAAAICAAYVATRPDIPPFDESALSIDRPEIPDNINGAILLRKVVGDSKSPRIGWRDDYDEGVKDKRNPADFQVKFLQSKYGGRIEQIKQAAFSKYFQEPMRGKQWLITATVPDYLAVRDYSRLNSTLAWADLRKGDEEAAMKRMRANLKLASALMGNKAGMICFMIGTSIENLAIIEIDAMIDENLLSSAAIAGVLELLKDENTKVIENFKNAVKVRYKIINPALEHLLTDIHALEPIYSELDSFTPILFIRKNAIRKIVFDSYKSIYDDADKLYKDLIYAPRPLTVPFHGKGNLHEVFNTANTEVAVLFIQGISNYKEFVVTKRTKNELFRTKAAITLYKIKYGKLPENLNALTPEFLTSTPIDPFDGNPVRYNKSKNLIYSVGYNLKDDGGSAKMQVLAENANATEMKKEKDIILPLSPPNKTHP